MWPYACLSDCKVMVKCVESDGKVIATHVSVQSHHQPVRPDREGCRHPSCVSCMRRRQAADWVHALPSLHGRVIRVCPIARMYASVTVLGRWVRLFHSLPPAATPGTFMCCHGACGRVIRVCPIARMYASVTVLGRWDRFHSLPPAATPGTCMCCRACHSCVSHRQDVRECNGAG